MSEPGQGHERLRGRKILLYAGATGLAGGPQLNAKELAKVLHGAGARVIVATLTGLLSPEDSEEIRQHARLVGTPFGGFRWGLFRNISALIWWFLTVRPRSQDVVVCMGYGGFHSVMPLFVRRGGLVIERDTGDGATSSATPPKSFFRFVRRVDAVLVLSKGIRDSVLQRWPVTGPVIVIPEIVPPIVCSRSVRESADLRVAFLGRLAPSKNVDLLIRLWPKLQVENAELHVYGSGPDEEKLRTQALETAPGRIHFHGGYDRSQVGSILAETDLVVLPSTAEGLPTVLIEAMLCGVPFVATIVGAVAELSSEHPDLIAVPFDEDAVAQAIEEQLRRVREGRIDNEGIARRAQQRFGYNQVSERWLEILSMAPEELRANFPASSIAEEYGA